MLTIHFNELSAILLDVVDGSYSEGGFLYLRLVGEEPTVNAIWSRLSAREYREKKYDSGVQVEIPGRQYPEYLAAQKVVYKTLRTRLPTGLIDLAMIHPRLTVSEDSEQGFLLLTYERGVPSGFLARLNRCLSIPLKDDWQAWLWREGQKQQSWLTIERKETPGNGQVVQEQLVQTHHIPITRYESRGQVACYRVGTAGPYKEAWLQIIRQQARLGVHLSVIPESTTGKTSYYHSDWTLLQDDQIALGHWRLDHLGQTQLAAPSLEHLLTAAREQLGIPFVIGQPVPG